MAEEKKIIDKNDPNYVKSGKNRIHLCSRANTNGFKQNPENAGRPEGRKDFNTLVKEAMKEKGEEGDPRAVLAREWVDILLSPHMDEKVKIKALKELTDRLEGSITQKQEVDVSTPIIEITQEQSDLLDKVDLD